jgi:hypothetical protein
VRPCDAASREPHKEAARSKKRHRRFVRYKSQKTFDWSRISVDSAFSLPLFSPHGVFVNAQFGPAITYVLANEKAYSADPADPGNWTGGQVNAGTLKGTNFGISAAAYPDVDIRNLTREDAIAIYERDFWIFGGLASQRMATKLFDAYVNEKHHAVRMAQLALGYLQSGPIVADGQYGAQTEAHLNAVDEDSFVNEFKARLAKSRADAVLAEPARAEDLLGWLRRDVKG